MQRVNAANLHIHSMPRHTGRQFYNYESGQVFTETTCKARKRTTPWYRESLGSAKLISSKSNEGTKTLRTTALQTLLKNLDLLDVESLRSVEWATGQELLSTIEESGLKSFAVWRIFTTRYFKDKPGNYKRHLSDANHELDIVIEDLARFSQGSPFLTFLTVNDCLLLPQSYLKLSSLPNLAVLKLWETGRSDTPASFNERILRGWQSSTVETVGFRSLRALEVTDIGLESENLLAYLEQCRNLSLVRILPRHEESRRTSVAGSWTQLQPKGKRSSMMLLGGEVTSPSVLLSYALKAAVLPQPNLPYCAISYGKNEDTRYYRERPAGAEVWVRGLARGKRPPSPQVEATLSPEHRTKRRMEKSRSLEDILGSFNTG